MFRRTVPLYAGEIELYKEYSLPTSKNSAGYVCTQHWIINLFYACQGLADPLALRYVVQIMAFIYNDTDLRKSVQSLHTLLDVQDSCSIKEFSDNIATLLKEKR